MCTFLRENTGGRGLSKVGEGAHAPASPPYLAVTLCTCARTETEMTSTESERNTSTHTHQQQTCKQMDSKFKQINHRKSAEPDRGEMR